MNLVVCAIIYVISAWILPFPNWKSFSVPLKTVLVARDIRFRHRLRMLFHLFRDVALLPVWAAFWLTDEIIYGTFRHFKVIAPLFIFSQPRSGSTFLLRTLSGDSDTFLSVKHLEWRYPYISFWKLLDLLKLRHWLENRSYWPDTELGRKCEKLHSHILGNYEEFGIFLEEKFYHHYFVYRRFPFGTVLERASGFKDLPKNEQDEMIDTLTSVVKKVYFYRGSSSQIFLAKENEDVDFCKALVERLPDARILMICRDAQPMLDSYLTMSIDCTKVKQGIDPTSLPGWHQENMRFRREQCQKFIEFWYSVKSIRTAVLITFSEFTTNLLKTTEQAYKDLDLPISPEFLSHLRKLEADQTVRKKGYKNIESAEGGFEFYEQFVREAEAQKMSYIDTDKVSGEKPLVLAEADNTKRLNTPETSCPEVLFNAGSEGGRVRSII